MGIMSKERKTYNVRPEDRNNHLSLKPTNTTITVRYANYDKVYDNIHYPQAFAKRIINGDDNWIAMLLNGKPWKNNY